MNGSATSGIDLASVDRVLKSTRSVRLRLDLERPVPQEIVEECIEVALQAPTGANSQTWRFVVVTDATKRERLAELYRAGAELYMQGKTGLSRTGVTATTTYAAGDPRAAQMPGVIRSAGHLMENLGRVPVHVIPCIEGRFETDDVFTQSSMYGSILPAAWSFMLALRARGLASAWTTLHLLYEQEAAELLGIPPTVTQALLLPVAWLAGGDLKPAPRLPARTFTYWNGWGAPRVGR